MRYSGKPNNLVKPEHGNVGYDLRSNEDTVILPGEQRKVKTGVILEIPNSFFGFIRDRSSITLEQLHVQAGIIDPSYRGEIVVILYSSRITPFILHEGERIAQLILVPAFVPPLKHVDESELTKTLRGTNGFGSTGKF